MAWNCRSFLSQFFLPVLQRGLQWPAMLVRKFLPFTFLPAKHRDSQDWRKSNTLWIPITITAHCRLLPPPALWFMLLIWPTALESDMGGEGGNSSAYVFGGIVCWKWPPPILAAQHYYSLERLRRKAYKVAQTHLVLQSTKISSVDDFHYLLTSSDPWLSSQSWTFRHIWKWA